MMRPQRLLKEPEFLGSLTVRILIFRERHLQAVLADYEAHNDGRRPHRSRHLQPPRPGHLQPPRPGHPYSPDLALRPVAEADVTSMALAWGVTRAP